MRLVRLLYTSRATGPIQPELALDIARRAARRNLERGLTGALAWGEDSFLQILEGDRLRVTELFGRIASDGRHNQVALMSLREVDARAFPVWSNVPLNCHQHAIVSRYCCDDRFTPWALSATAAEALVLDLRDMDLAGEAQQVPESKAVSRYREIERAKSEFGDERAAGE